MEQPSLFDNQGPEQQPIHERRDPHFDIGYSRLLGESEKKPSSESIFMLSHQWTPLSKGEVGMANTGLRSRLQSDVDKRPFNASLQTYTMAEQYSTNANMSIALLTGLIQTDGDTEFIDLYQARESTEVQYLLARQVEAHESLRSEKMKPANRKRNINKYRKLVAELSDEDLESLITSTVSSEEKRVKFWHSELISVENMPRVKEIKSEARYRMQRR